MLLVQSVDGFSVHYSMFVNNNKHGQYQEFIIINNPAFYNVR